MVRYALLAIPLSPKPILTPIGALCINGVGVKLVAHEVWKDGVMPCLVEIWILYNVATLVASCCDGANNDKYQLCWYSWTGFREMQAKVNVLPLFTRRTGTQFEAAWFGFRIFSRSELWLPPRQKRSRDACQTSEWCDYHNTSSRDFEAG